MTLLKIIGSLYCSAGWLRNIWGIRYRTNGDWTPLNQQNDFGCGQEIIQYQNVPETCDLQVMACNEVYAIWPPWGFIVEIVGIGSQEFGPNGDGPLYACGSGMPTHLPKDWPLGSIDPSWAWSTLTHGESIALAGAIDPSLVVGGHSILGYWVRKVRPRIDITLADDHNIPRLVFLKAKDIEAQKQ